MEAFSPSGFAVADSLEAEVPAGTAADVAGAVALIAGIVCYIKGCAYDLWYPLVLIGTILVLVISINIPVILRRYTAVEKARMQALDQSDSI